MIGIASRPLEKIREVLLGGDEAAGEAQLEGLAGEHLDLRPVPREPERMKVRAHHGLRLLELRLQPGRGVGEALLRGGEAIIGGDEGVGQALRDPGIRLPGFPPEDDEVLGREGAGLAEVLLLYFAEVGEQARDGTALGMVVLWP